ncbi:MAG: hypothetical protein COX77_04120 [Candidatus Komeilibacteria bacterium CG_4_10_14_0_2_um_filter_37_10]|uniref:DNA-directed DNA polymerase n=1 Tax=Candidatus Komeilibacteria bacterium CG_4_10_14_0_2_um_filter_37_10 TaxID=1974470 RepID=A0A2M7VDN5_9BACT|nr:MAG: hypothetical protein COX77_04120 [Candidatus Komeilibacteria bacterium CG_4_10_14_0_2_um_filter_37_10]
MAFENEIAKLVAYEKNVTRENINLLVDAGVDVGIFNLLDAIAAKNKSQALKNLGDLLEKGENEIFILTMIQKQIHNLALIFEKKKAGLSESQIAQILKLHPFVVKKALGALRQVGDTEVIKRYYGSVTEAEFFIKTGQKEPNVALELLVLNLSK